MLIFTHYILQYFFHYISMLGHALGAAGSIESIFTILGIYYQTMPHTRNLTELDTEFTLDYIMKEPRESPINAALSNSFGFGGTNASLLFKRFQG